MPTRTRKTGTSKSSTRRPRRHAQRNASAGATPKLQGISPAERRKLAQEEARWRAESDLRTLLQARRFDAIPPGSNGPPPWLTRR
jgi:hypothetical protein